MAQPPILDAVEAISAGLEHTCALRAGRVYCWGQDIGAVPQSETALEVPGLTDIAAIDSGGRRTCALSKNGELTCWGEVLDDGGGLSIRWGRMKRLDFGRPITKVAVGITHICALTDAKDLFCWGANNGHQMHESRPMERPGLIADRVDTADVGHGWTCYARAGEHRCLGTHPNMKSLMQQENLQFPGWVIASCGVSSDGEVFCLGRAGMVYGGGPMPAEPGGEPVKIAGLEHVRQLSMGTHHACVVKDDAGVWCWGNRWPPTAVALPAPARRVESNLGGACALLDRGDVMCWPGGGSQATPMRVTAGGGAASIAVLPLDDVKRRYAPGPAELAGTEWNVCLERCDECRYVLRFLPRGVFSVDRRCKSRRETLQWTGKWKRTGDIVRVREKPAPAGNVWRWNLEIVGQTLSGTRETDGTRTPVTGIFDTGSARP